MSLHYRMILAYDGTCYRGWQVQPGRDTIQGRLEQALGRMAKAPAKVVAAGRTDAGVHALAQVAHFRLRHQIPADGILRGLNAMLPRDIRVLAVAPTDPSFHARYSARSKTYRYHLERAPVALPFRCRYTHHYPHRLDRARLDEAATSFLGEHDFAAFRASSCSAKTTLRRVTVSRFFEEGTELVYEVSASGFLQHMVRNMVGTLLEIGRHKLPVSVVEELFATNDRAGAGPTAPARGLHLVRVDYDR